MAYTCGKKNVYIPDAGCDDCARFERELEQVKTKNTEQDGRLTELESTSATLNNRVGTLEADNTESKGRISTLEGSTSAINDRLNATEDTVDVLEDCCTEVRTTLVSHDGRINNNAQDITTVNNRFDDYYPKEDLYTQEQVDHLISQIETSSCLEVDELPEVGQGNVIYLVPKQGGGYERWIYSNGEWKDLGSDEVDLSQYVRVDEVVDMIHPIGDTVIRMDNVNPGTLYTGTTWQKISEGKVLLGADGTNYTAGNSYGNAEHTHTNPTTSGSSAANTGGNNGNTGSTTLTAAQSGVPAHGHGHSLTLPNHVHKSRSSTHTYFLNVIDAVNRRTIKNGTGTEFTGNMHSDNTLERNSNTGNPTSLPAISGSVTNNSAANASSGHTHTLNNHTHTMAHTHTQGNTGSADNLPLSLAVNIWIRTA